MIDFMDLPMQKLLNLGLSWVRFNTFVNKQKPHKFAWEATIFHNFLETVQHAPKVSFRTNLETK
jgi:hypothetical protein